MAWVGFRQISGALGKGIHKGNWRIPSLFAAAIVFPIVLFTAVLLGLDAQSKRVRVEDLATYSAHQIISLVDVETTRSVSSLQLLASSHQMTDANWAAGEIRAREVMGINPDWKSVTLVDDRTGESLFSTLPQAPVFNLLALPVPEAETTPRIFGIGKRPGGCTCIVIAHRLAAPHPHLILFVELSPARLQQILVAQTPHGALSAIVDGDGRFIARSQNIDTRLATPATHFVHDAVARARSGFYRGTTYEGMENYTAFASSDLDNWSAHLAVSSGLVSQPEVRIWTSIALAILATVSFAGFAAWINMNTQAAQMAAEDRLVTSERMDALGQLTGGIAHDFNNMLAVIVGNLELARLQIGRGGDPGKFLETALEGANRSRELTQRMLAFARKQDLSMRDVDVNQIVSSTVGLLERTIGEHIKLSFNGAEGLSRAWVDGSQLENALINLAANGRDAMPSGGVIAFETYSLVAGTGFNRLKLDRDMVCVSVTDVGIGMTPEVLRRATDPFYSTKGAAGTGLGLAQIAGFVEQSQGLLEIVSRPGQGTCVRIALPPAERSSGVSHDAETSAMPFRALRILLVEDDPRVRATTEAALRELGHRVTAVDSPHAALTKSQQIDIDLVVSDILMPGMNGRELASMLTRSNPRLKVLLVSAYEPGAIADDRWPLLRKPFSILDLGSAVMAAAR